MLPHDSSRSQSGHLLKLTKNYRTINSALRSFQLYFLQIWSLLHSNILRACIATIYKDLWGHFGLYIFYYSDTMKPKLFNSHSLRHSACALLFFSFIVIVFFPFSILVFTCFFFSFFHFGALKLKRSSSAIQSMQSERSDRLKMHVNFSALFNVYNSFRSGRLCSW